MAVLIFESIGVVVFRDIVLFEMVGELLGGVCVEFWRRPKNYTDDSRVERDRKTMSEWFQWLAERLEEQHARNGRKAAYEQHRHWRS